MLAQRSVAFQLALVAGPPATGGILFAVSELVYAVAVGIALVALVCVLALRSGREPAVEGAAGLEEVLAGVRLIRRTKVLLGAISLDLFAVLLGGAVALLDLREGHPRGRAHRPRASSDRARNWDPSRRSSSPVAPSSGRRSRTLFLVVAAFGACMVVFGLSREMWLSMAALALAGGFDLVSVVLRSTILPLVTPDELRGRVNAVEMVFISASNELGAFESGVAAALIGAVRPSSSEASRRLPSRSWWRLFPSLRRVDRLDELRPRRDP